MWLILHVNYLSDTHAFPMHNDPSYGKGPLQLLLNSADEYIYFYEYPSNRVRFEVFRAVTMMNAVFWSVTRVALVRTGVSEELKEPRSVTFQMTPFFIVTAVKAPTLTTRVRSLSLYRFEASCLAWGNTRHSCC
jgi:hypothetical protein